jgi:NADH-quinone oxidoreductase subunit L
MRRMGGLRKYMPITWITSLIGTLALVGTPFFSGYYSKDSIIIATEVAAEAGGWVQQYAMWAVLLGVFVTSFYSFRLLYLTFHGEERFRHAPAHGHDDHAHDDHAHDAHGHHGAHEPHESPWVVTLPLVLLAIPSIAIGFFTVGPMLFGDFFAGAISVTDAHNTLAGVAEKVWHADHGWVSAAVGFGTHFLASPVFWLAFAGFASATYIYLFNPKIAEISREKLAPFVRVLENKYGFDDLYQALFAGGSLKLGRAFWRGGDTAVIDGVLVDGSASLVDRIASIVRHVQSGFLYHYALAMIVGLVALLGVLIYSLG